MDVSWSFLRCSKYSGNLWSQDLKIYRHNKLKVSWVDHGPCPQSFTEQVCILGSFTDRYQNPLGIPEASLQRPISPHIPKWITFNKHSTHTIGQQNDSHAHQTSPDQLSSTSSRSLISARPYLANHIKAHLSHHNPIPATSSFSKPPPPKMRVWQWHRFTNSSSTRVCVPSCSTFLFKQFFFGKGSSNHNKSCSLQEKSSNGALYSSLGRGATQPVA